MSGPLELFHAIGDPASAEARTFIKQHHLQLTFRNIFYPEVQADLAARGGGSVTPAVWDGATLHSGREAVLAFLEALRQGG